MVLHIALYLKMALKLSFSSRLLQLFGMKSPCNTGIACKQWIALYRKSLTLPFCSIVVLWEGILGRLSQWLRKAAEKTLCMHPSNIHIVGSMCTYSI
jgi:hypothetical protein